jgi:hypothetical protein
LTDPPEKIQYTNGSCPLPDRTLLVGGKASEVTFYIDAVSVNEWLGMDGLSYDPMGGIYDPDPLAFVLVKRLRKGERMPSPEALQAEREQRRAEHLERLNGSAVGNMIEPLVLRVNAGDCIRVELSNRLPAQLSDRAGDALMPKIVPLNVDVKNDGTTSAFQLGPSSRITLHPQLLSYNVNLYNGAKIGFNQDDPEEPSAETETGEKSKKYYWYAGIPKITNGTIEHEAREFGAVNLTSWGDIISHGPHGLVGALIVEPAGSVYYDPDTNEPVENGGISARIEYPDPRNPEARRSFREHVVLYRDGLNLWYQNGTGKHEIPDCRICDDSYDLGEKAFNYRTAPFTTRLNQEPDTNLNAALFPERFFTPAYRPIPTATYRATPGEEVWFRVLQPHGRNRQHAFVLYGHDYEDMLPRYGSRGSSLISVGKAVTVTIPEAHPGRWMYRDGPAHMWSSGLWGEFVVGTPGNDNKAATFGK